MLRAFSAKHYRHVYADDLKLERLNIFVGPNNAGKSTLIEALRLAGDLLLEPSTGSALEIALHKRGRGDLLDRDVPVPGEIEMKWTLDLPEFTDQLIYELALRLGRSEDFPSAFYITREQLRYASPKQGKKEPFRFIDCHTKRSGKGRFSVRDTTQQPKLLTLDVDEHDTVFRQLKLLLRDKRFYNEVYPQFEQSAEAVRTWFEGFQAYSSATIDPERVVEGVTRDLSIRALDPAGVQFVNVLRYMDQEHGLDEYTRILGEVLPDLRRVQVVDVSEDRQQVVLQIGEGRRFKMREMSHGTIKAMLLALLLSAPMRMTLLAIDEPELNLHPAWLRVLGKWLTDCRSANQLVISTHSPDLLDRLTEAYRSGEAALFVFSWPGKGIRRLEPSELDDFFQEGWELGDLYRVGEPRLGGWPW